MSTRNRSGPKPGTSPRTLMFAAGGLPLGVPLEDLLRVVEVEEWLPVPMGHHALVGVTTSLEGVTPVYDLGRLAMTTEAVAGPPPGGLVAMFPHPQGSVGVRIDKLAGLSDAPEALTAELQANLCKALPSLLSTLITGAATSRGQVFYFFSRDALLGWLHEQAARR